MNFNELTDVGGGGGGGAAACGTDSSFTKGCDDTYHINIDRYMKNNIEYGYLISDWFYWSFVFNHFFIWIICFCWLRFLK